MAQHLTQRLASSFSSLSRNIRSNGVSLNTEISLSRCKVSSKFSSQSLGSNQNSKESTFPNFFGNDSIGSDEIRRKSSARLEERLRGNSNLNFKDYNEALTRFLEERLSPYHAGYKHTPQVLGPNEWLNPDTATPEDPVATPYESAYNSELIFWTTKPNKHAFEKMKKKYEVTYHHYSDQSVFPFGLTPIPVASGGEESTEVVVIIDWNQRVLVVRTGEPDELDYLLAAEGNYLAIDREQQVHPIPAEWLLAFKKVQWPYAEQYKISSIVNPVDRQLNDKERKFMRDMARIWEPERVDPRYEEELDETPDPAKVAAQDLMDEVAQIAEDISKDDKDMQEIISNQSGATYSREELQKARLRHDALPSGVAGPDASPLELDNATRERIAAMRNAFVKVKVDASKIRKDSPRDVKVGNSMRPEKALNYESDRAEARTEKNRKFGGPR